MKSLSSAFVATAPAEASQRASQVCMSPTSDTFAGASEGLPRVLSDPVSESIDTSVRTTVDSQIEALVVHFNRTNQGAVFPFAVNMKMEELLFGKGPSSYMATSSHGSKDPAWRWIHLPANNMSWVQKVMEHVLKETSIEVGNDIEHHPILRPEFWKGREHRGSGSLQGRYLKPLYSKINSTRDLLVDGHTMIQDKSHHAVLFMPYIHWETQSKYLLRNLTLDWMSSAYPDIPPTRTAKSHPLRYPYLQRQERERLEEKRKLTSKSKKPRRSETNDSEDSTNIWRHENLVRAYVNDESWPLHVRRTLDQYFYYTLPDRSIRERDLDQVLWRYTKDTNPRILMVDQLWLWVIDNPKHPGEGQTVITAFPERWSEARMRHSSAYPPCEASDVAPELSDIRFRILSAIQNQERTLDTASDLASLIIDKCTSIFHPRANETELSPDGDFLDVFADSIAQLADRHTSSADQFWKHVIGMQGLQNQLRRLLRASLRDLLWQRADEDEDEPFTDANDFRPIKRRERLRSRLNDIHSKVNAKGVSQAGVNRPSTAEQIPVMSYADYKERELAREPPTEILYRDIVQENRDIYQQRNVAQIEEKIRNNLDALVDNAEETDCLREIQDIMDELNSIASVFKVQKTVTDAFCEDSSNQDKTHSSQRICKLLAERFEDIKSLISAAERVHRSLLDLLDLKQKQASVAEAHASAREVEETTRQSQTILLFTVTTIIYATLSLIAGVFSMNAKEINGWENRSLNDIVRIMVPTTVGVLVVAFTLAYNGTVNWFFEGIFKWKRRKRGPATPAETKKQAQVTPAIVLPTFQVESLKGGIAIGEWEFPSEVDLEAGGPRDRYAQMTGPDSPIVSSSSRRSVQFSAATSSKQGDVVAMGAMRPRRT